MTARDTRPFEGWKKFRSARGYSRLSIATKRLRQTGAPTNATRATGARSDARQQGRTFDPGLLEVFFDIIDSLEDTLPVLTAPPVSLLGVEPISTDRLFEPGFGSRAEERRTKRRCATLLRPTRMLSLYEISQTLGSTLKLSEVLPIVAAKLEHIANFTTLVIYLAEGNKLRAAYVIGKNAEALKACEMAVAGVGGVWLAEHRQVLIGRDPLADLPRPLGAAAARLYSTAIFPLDHEGVAGRTLALYCEEDRDIR